MKIFITILFISLSRIGNAQFKKANSISLDSFVVTTSFGIKREVHGNHSSFNQDYTLFIDSSKDLYIKPLKTFYHSSTIFDESKIVLIDEKRFFCFYMGCMQRVSSAGYYKKTGNRYIFNSDKIVASSLKGKIDPELLSLEFIDITGKEFAENGGKLTLVK